MTPALSHYLLLSAVLFAIGLYGALARRNAVIILLGIEIMMNAANLNLVAFSRYLQASKLAAQIFAFFGITIAAAEVAVGLAIVISIYKIHRSIDVQEVHDLKY